MTTAYPPTSVGAGFRPTLEQGKREHDFQRLDKIVQDGIKTYLQVGHALLEIKFRQLYCEHFDTWEDYCRSRIGFTARRVDQMIAGWQFYEVIQNARSDDPELPPPTSEWQTRPISALPDDEAVQTWFDATTIHGDTPSHHQVKSVRARREAAEQAGYGPEDTDTPLNGPPPPSKAQQKREAYRRQVYGYKYALVTQMMNQGTMTPKEAMEVCVALESVSPRVRGDMLRIQMMDKTLINEMDRLYRRKSETYQEIVASGHLQFDDHAIPASKAKPNDLRILLQLKAEEHRRRAMVERDAAQNVQEHLLTVWTGPDESVMAKNIKALESAIGSERLRRLCEAYLKAAQGR